MRYSQRKDWRRATNVELDVQSLAPNGLHLLNEDRRGPCQRNPGDHNMNTSRFNWAAARPQTRSTLNGSIEQKLAKLGNESSLPCLELDVSPQLAKHWLEWNECVRRLSESMVKTIAHAIAIGQFPFVGDPIRLGELDKKTLRRPLRDGQHRLSAIARSDKTVRLLVMFNFPDDLFAFVDGGHPRKARDFLNVESYNLSSLIAGAARLVYMFERKIEFLNQSFTALPTTRTEILDVDDRHPGIRTWAKETFRTKRMRIAQVAAASYWISTTNDARTDEFLTKLFDPSGLNTSDVLYRLGEKIRWQRKDFYRTGRDRLRMIWDIFRAWELFKDGETRQIIRFTGGAIPWPGGARYL